VVVDLRKIILRSRHYPDKICWEAEDPGSYKAACDANIIDRSECSRHMDPRILKNVSLDQILQDIRFYRTHSLWRQGSPVLYWGAHKKQFMSNPKVVRKLGREQIRWTFHNIRIVTLQCKDTEEWKRRSKSSFRAAQTKGWSHHPALIGHMLE